MKKKILILLVLIILMIGIIVLVPTLNKEDNKQSGDENNDLTNDIGNANINNGLVLDNSRIICNEDICTISIMANNATPNDIDMSGYRISFLNVMNDEIYWFGGESIGLVNAYSKKTFSLEIPSYLQNIYKIVYDRTNY